VDRRFEKMAREDGKAFLGEKLLPLYIRRDHKWMNIDQKRSETSSWKVSRVSSFLSTNNEKEE